MVGADSKVDGGAWPLRVARRKTRGKGGKWKDTPALFIKKRGQTAGAKIEGPEAAKGGAVVASIFGS